MDSLIEKLPHFLVYFSAFLVALSVHESAHALIAAQFGDLTAKHLGRISLNPLVHMDVVGTFLLPVFLFISGWSLPIAGWGKPVPVNPHNLKNPREDNLWIALAGPISNLLLALLFALTLKHLVPYLNTLALEGHSESSSLLFYFRQFLKASLFINLGLAFFNLIPLHPLDGGKVIEGFLPEAWVPAFNRLAQHGILIIIFLYYFKGFSFLHQIIERSTILLLR